MNTNPEKKIESRELVSQKEDIKKLREIINADAKNRAELMREIREMVQIESTMNRDFRRTEVLPHAQSNTDILIFTP